MSKFKELLEEAKKEKEGLSNRKVVFQDILAEQGDYLVQDLMDQVGELHQTIVTLETDRKVLDQENSELKRQLLESKSRLQMLSQEMAARDKRLEEDSQSHQALVGQLKTGIQEKAARVRSLEEEMGDLKSKYQQKFQTFEKDEILKGLTKERLNRMTKKLLEELLTRASPIPLKVTCPHCKGDVSVRFRLRLKSKERDTNQRKEFIDEIKKNS